MASSLFNYTTSNPTLLALPAWHLLALIPKNYGIYLSSQGGDLSKFDNRNPRSTEIKNDIKTRLSPEQYAKWERAEACSANTLENLPLVGLAVLAGNIAKVPRAGTFGLDNLVGALLALRVIYTGVYLGNDNQSKSAARTGLFFAQVGICYNILFKAAKLLI